MSIQTRIRTLEKNCCDAQGDLKPFIALERCYENIVQRIGSGGELNFERIPLAEEQILIRAKALQQKFKTMGAYMEALSNYVLPPDIRDGLDRFLLKARKTRAKESYAEY